MELDHTSQLTGQRTAEAHVPTLRPDVLPSPVPASSLSPPSKGVSGGDQPEEPAQTLTGSLCRFPFGSQAHLPLPPSPGTCCSVFSPES